MSRSRLNLLGIILLIVGMASADVILLRERNNTTPSDEDVFADQEATKAYQASVERNVGKTGAMMGSWFQDLGDLGRPKPLAITVGVVACLSAGGCFWTARRKAN